MILRFVELTVAGMIATKTKKISKFDFQDFFWISSGPNIDFWNFPFSCASLKPSSACCTFRENMVECAFERTIDIVFDSKTKSFKRRPEHSIWIEISIGPNEKFKNQCFWFFTFSFHEATLEADIASYKWTIDTVDGALETLDLNLSKRDGVRKHPDVLGAWWEG